jgi:hypothetical protein
MLHTTIWFDLITYKDSKALKRWWYAHTIHDYDIRRSPSNSRYWALYRIKRVPQDVHYYPLR